MTGNGRDKLHSVSLRALPLLAALALISVGYFPLIQPKASTEYFRVVHRIRLRGPTYAIAWSADGSRLAILDRWNIAVYDARDWSLVARKQVIQRLFTGRSISFIDNDQVIVGGDGVIAHDDRNISKHALTIWSLSKDDPTGFIPSLQAAETYGPFYPQDDFVLAPSKESVASRNINDKGLYIFGVDAAVQNRFVEAPMVPKPLPQFDQSPVANEFIRDRFSAEAYAPDGRQLGACSASGRVYFISPESGKITETLVAYDEGVRCTALAYSANGQFIATGREYLHFKRLGRQPRAGDKMELEDDTGDVYIWSVSDRIKLGTIRISASAVRDLAWQAQGKVLAVAGDKDLTLWKAEAKTLTIEPLQSFDGSCYAISFSSDGLLAAVHGTDVMIYATSDRT